MKKSDNIDFKTFLEIDENIFKDGPLDFYRQKSIYLIYYPHGNKASYSNGKIKNINIELNNIEHICSTKPGSSGCPIINLNNNRVIGIHKGAHKFEDWNLGVFIKQPIEKFYEKYNKNENKDFDYEILEENYHKYELKFKVIVIGNTGKKIYIFIYIYIDVGKSSLSFLGTKREVKNIVSTVGIGVLYFNIRINNRIIKLEIFDTCGQEKYRSLVSRYYKYCSLAFIVYSIVK